MHHIYPPSPSVYPLCLCLPVVFTPRQDLFYLPDFHLLKCILIVQEGFILAFHTCVSCTLIRSIISITYSMAPLLYYSTVFCTFHYSTFTHKCNVFQYYSLSFYFSLPQPHIPLKQTHDYNYVL
jgi:hypothetical protein